LLVFDEQGILRNHKSHQGKEHLGLGAGINLLLSKKNLIDTSYLEKSAAVDQWGASLLKPIDKVLNLHYSLETGTNGVEQIGTPTTVGQHSLEFE
jgi:biotin-(acetyl-CoA carboxylase) ligase